MGSSPLSCLLADKHGQRHDGDGSESPRPSETTDPNTRIRWRSLSGYCSADVVRRNDLGAGDEALDTTESDKRLGLLLAVVILQVPTAGVLEMNSVSIICQEAPPVGAAVTWAMKCLRSASW